MKKIAIFTEGQSELMFIRYLLLTIIDNSRLSYECIKLKSERTYHYPYIKYDSPDPDFYFIIINVGNDERVLSSIKEREEGLFGKGYHEIIGLRDMYCEVYDKRSTGRIDNGLSEQFINRSTNVISDMSNPEAISLFFSIMELEAWFLSMYNLFQKINPALTLEYIERECGYNLKNIDPQTNFYRPSNEIIRIMNLIGIDYDKHIEDIDRITNRMEGSDYTDAFENERCQNFMLFYQKIQSIVE